MKETKETKELSTSSSPALIFLRNEYLRRRKNNRHYSISAFARDLDLSSSFLSRVLNGERTITINFALQIASIFNLPTLQTNEWVAEIVATASKNAKISVKLREQIRKSKERKNISPQYYEVERFKSISQWHHLAILNLTYVQDFNPSPIWIAKRLGISRIETTDAITRLLELGLLERTQKTLKCTNNTLFVDTKKSELCVREFHRQMSARAIDALQDGSEETFDARYIAGLTLAFDRKRIKEFREKIKAFQLEIMQMAKSETYTDVYQFNLQLFPLTQKRR